MTCARFDRRISFLDLDAQCLLHLSQLLELRCFGDHLLRNGKERLRIRIERWPDGEVYVRKVLDPVRPIEYHVETSPATVRVPV